MSETLKAIKRLIQDGDFRVSEHGYDEFAADDLYVRDVIAGITDAVVIEDYPKFPKGACVLVLQQDSNHQPIHVIWGIPKGCTSPAVLVTAYKPNPELWDESFQRRRK